MENKVLERDGAVEEVERRGDTFSGVVEPNVALAGDSNLKSSPTLGSRQKRELAKKNPATKRRKAASPPAPAEVIQKPKTSQEGEAFQDPGTSDESKGRGTSDVSQEPDALEVIADGKGPGAHHIELGRRGEEAAVKFLERRGYEVVERNWVCSAGEADIIVQDEHALVFVEVKTRSNCDKGLPAEAVNAEKRHRYEKIAAHYLQSYEGVDITVRFDVISILAVAPDRAFLRHHINAFSCGE